MAANTDIVTWSCWPGKIVNFSKKQDHHDHGRKFEMFSSPDSVRGTGPVASTPISQYLIRSPTTVAISSPLPQPIPGASDSEEEMEEDEEEEEEDQPQQGKMYRPTQQIEIELDGKEANGSEEEEDSSEDEEEVKKKNRRREDEQHEKDNQADSRDVGKKKYSGGKMTQDKRNLITKNRRNPLEGGALTKKKMPWKSASRLDKGEEEVSNDEEEDDEIDESTTGTGNEEEETSGDSSGGPLAASSPIPRQTRSSPRLSSRKPGEDRRMDASNTDGTHPAGIARVKNLLPGQRHSQNKGVTTSTLKKDNAKGHDYQKTSETGKKKAPLRAEESTAGRDPHAKKVVDADTTVSKAAGNRSLRSTPSTRQARMDQYVSTLHITPTTHSTPSSNKVVPKSILKTRARRRPASPVASTPESLHSSDAEEQSRSEEDEVENEEQLPRKIPRQQHRRSSVHFSHAALQQTDGNTSRKMPGARRRSTNLPSSTPSTVSASMFVMTPKSGPVRRKKSRHLEVDHVALPILEPLALQYEVNQVRLWQGQDGSQRRTSAQVTDLDVCLTLIEETAWNFKNLTKMTSPDTIYRDLLGLLKTSCPATKEESVEDHPCRKAINIWARGTLDDVRTTISTADTLKKLKLSVKKRSMVLKRKRQMMLEKKREASLLNAELATLKMKKAANTKQPPSTENLQEISTFLHKLQALNDMYAKSKQAKHKQQEHVTIGSLSTTLLQAQVPLQAGPRLKEMNDRIENWLQAQE